MGEIKSTLELAMERTKKFAISEKEKEEIKQKEILQKTTSLFHRYREGHLSLNEILKQIEKMEKKTAITVRESLLSQWIDALSLDDDDERILKGIESLKRRSIDEVKQKFNHLLAQYQREKEKVKEKVRVQFTKDLRRDGIYGSAVEPKLEGGELWKKENEKLGQIYKAKLEEIKEQLRTYK
jgi:citrate lyase alpha subunit